jgi:four helix bundle protein
MASNWKGLLVWQKAHEIVLDVYKLAKCFPKIETYSLVDQIKRAAYSVPANIVEGYSKNTRKEFLRHLYIARGSLEELRYFLLLSKDLSYITENQYNDIEARLTEVSYLLNQLIKSLTSKTSHTPSTSTTSKAFTPSKTSTSSTPSTPSPSNQPQPKGDPMQSKIAVVGTGYVRL